MQSVGGGFLTHKESLQFFVGARSGSCAGAPDCFDGQFNGNATGGSVACWANARPSLAIQKGTRVLISLWDSLMFGRVPGTSPNISESHREIRTRVLRFV